MRRLMPAALLLVALTAVLHAAPEESHESPQAFAQRLAQAHNAGDLAAIAAMYSADAREIMGPMSLSGRDNIRMQYQRIHGAMVEQDAEPETRITVEESWVDGDTAMLWGDFVVTDDAMGELAALRFVFRLKRDARSWKIDRSWFAV